MIFRYCMAFAHEQEVVIRKQNHMRRNSILCGEFVVCYFIFAIVWIGEGRGEGEKGKTLWGKKLIAFICQNFFQRCHIGYDGTSTTEYWNSQ
jgi:hypothetical protein